MTTKLLIPATALAILSACGGLDEAATLDESGEGACSLVGVLPKAITDFMSWAPALIDGSTYGYCGAIHEAYGASGWGLSSVVWDDVELGTSSACAKSSVSTSVQIYDAAQSRWIGIGSVSRYGTVSNGRCVLSVIRTFEVGPTTTKVRAIVTGRRWVDGYGLRSADIESYLHMNIN